jgi:hypothetical protein
MRCPARILVSIAREDLVMSSESSPSGIAVRGHVIVGHPVRTTPPAAKTQKFDLVVLGSEANRHSDAIMARTVPRRWLCSVVTPSSTTLDEDGVAHHGASA